MILPSGPEPVTSERLIPFWLAIVLANGLAITLYPEDFVLCGWEELDCWVYYTFGACEAVVLLWEGDDPCCKSLTVKFLNF